jgi:hypothetical protein
MILIRETELNLRAACALVNTDRVTCEEMTDCVALLTLTDEWSWTGRRGGDDGELNTVLDLRRRVDAIWDEADDETQTVCKVNALLYDTNAAPWLRVIPKCLTGTCTSRPMSTLRTRPNGCTRSSTGWRCMRSPLIGKTCGPG